MIFDDHIKIAKTDEIMYPLVTTIPLQILAYYSALTRGLDPGQTAQFGQICDREMKKQQKNGRIFIIICGLM